MLLSRILNLMNRIRPTILRELKSKILSGKAYQYLRKTEKKELLKKINERISLRRNPRAQGGLIDKPLGSGGKK